MNYEHIPVLLNEVIFYLQPKAGENFVDATLGGGGYTRAILEKIQPGGKVLAIDLDQDALENTKHQISRLDSEMLNNEPRRTNTKSLVLHKGNFQNINKITKEHEFRNISGIVADLGLSSHELDGSGRGFSFQKNEPLDMRFDQSQPEDAKFLLNNRSEQELVKIFNDYGEEKFSRQIARKVVGVRGQGSGLRHTDELYKIIEDSLPKPVKHKADDSARRIFQALRIAVNHELSSLEEFLPKAFDILNPGGRLVIVSFHSLEDRIVKQYFASLTKGCVCPIDFPQCVCGKNPVGKILTKKIVTASEEELAANPRSKPAKLRAIEKI